MHLGARTQVVPQGHLMQMEALYMVVVPHRAWTNQPTGEVSKSLKFDIVTQGQQLKMTMVGLEEDPLAQRH